MSNRDVFTRSDIEEIKIRVMLHDEDAGIGKIIGAEKFPPRAYQIPTRSPLQRSCQFGFVKAADQAAGTWLFCG